MALTISGFNITGNLTAVHITPPPPPGPYLWSWGRNIYGQLGDGTTTDRLTPVAVAGFGSGVVNVALGFVRLLFEIPVHFWWLLCVRCRVSGMLFVL